MNKVEVEVNNVKDMGSNKETLKTEAATGDVL